jgi:hypothetical protein
MFSKFIDTVQADSQKIVGLFAKFYFNILDYSQIWLNIPLDDPVTVLDMNFIFYFFLN